MKNLLFLCGPNGIGKTTVGRKIVEMRPHTAYVDSDPCRLMNPFDLNDDTIPTIAKNISDMIGNYWDCPAVDTVIFTYGFHGRRKEVFERILQNLSGREYHFLPFLLCCEEAENIKRMAADQRDPARIARAIAQSRQAFDGVPYPTIDVTSCTVSQTAQIILEKAGLANTPEERP